MSNQSHTTPPLHDCLQAHLEAYFDTLGDDAEASQIWNMVMQCVEKATLEKVMEKSQFNQSKAAEMLGITRNTLRKKLISYQIIN